MPEPDNGMQGKVCLITGANSGIGKETALGLARLGATVVLVCRDPSKGKAAQAEIAAQSGKNTPALLLADLASQDSVRQLAHDFKASYNRLDVLVNNAGISLTQRTLTKDGQEMVFAVNHLAYFLLTNLLLDILKASAPARIVNVSSQAQSSGKIDFDDMQMAKKYGELAAYSRSKLANVLFTYELARRLVGTKITANCLHPGAVRTNFAAESTGFFGTLAKLARPFELSPQKGAETSIYLAASPEVENVTGKYFSKKQEVKSSALSYDENLARQLWEVSAQLTHLDAVKN